MDARDLYGLPLERFTAARDALAKELRRHGRRDDAAQVMKLRKPSAAAWVVNQLVRTQRRDVDALFHAGDALQKAQAELIAGRGQPGALRTAQDAERAAVHRLLGSARGLLDAEGREPPPARLDQVSETLHAAALDGEARAKVSGGCLEHELRHVGLGPLGAALSPPPSPSAVSGRGRRQPPSSEATPKQEAELKAARAAQASARRLAEQAAREVETARAQRDGAASAVQVAQHALQRAEAALAGAEDALAGAEARAEAAARKLATADDALRRLTG